MASLSGRAPLSPSEGVLSEGGVQKLKAVEALGSRLAVSNGVGVAVDILVSSAAIVLELVEVSGMICLQPAARLSESFSLSSL